MKTHLLPIAMVIAVLVLAYTSYTTGTAHVEARHRVAKATEDLAKETRENTAATTELARVLERQTGPTCHPAKP